MHGLQSASASPCWRPSVLVCVLLATACGQPPSATVAPADGRRHFTGTWSATGSRQTLYLEWL
jgi:hypothetical protein